MSTSLDNCVIHLLLRIVTSLHFQKPNTHFLNIKITSGQCVFMGWRSLHRNSMPTS